ncbi:phage tail protein [Ancylobacter sp. FA202]|uniref:phage tail protein n=1 Tax=Ancylobacter sp. FA202 TaxID=1111106 RepID=UPI00035F02B2|nr:tail fiber protein [Ancylobacter sp. FA202]
MAEAYLGEIRLFPYDRVPYGWLPADGRLLSIAPNQALFALLQNTFGGDGKTQFALPDLRGRVPLCAGAIRDGTDRFYALGEAAGAETFTLAVKHLPAHTHTFRACTKEGTTGNSTNGHVATVKKDDLTPPNERLLYGAAVPGQTVALHPQSLSQVGSAGAHENMQPFAVGSYCICLRGIWPERE